MATLKLYNPILSEATKECYWFCDEAGTSFKDVDEFINGIPAGDDNIELLLHCDGGEVNEGWAIVDKLRSTGKKITATIEGNCASMATVVLLAASERRAYPHASLLIHKPYYPEYTLADAYRADDLESLAASLRDDEQKMLDFYVERTGADRAELEALMNEDKFIGMERAKELGFIQTIIPAASASAGGPNSAKSAAWKQQNSITNNQNSMATKTTKSEDKSVLRKALAALAVALGLEAPQPVNYELNTESGDTITIDKPDGEDPAVGGTCGRPQERKNDRRETHLESRRHCGRRSMACQGQVRLQARRTSNHDHSRRRRQEERRETAVARSAAHRRTRSGTSENGVNHNNTFNYGKHRT
jgi:ATP-dependent Clp protease protease subunit